MTPATLPVTSEAISYANTVLRIKYGRRSDVNSINDIVGTTTNRTDRETVITSGDDFGARIDSNAAILVDNASTGDSLFRRVNV